MPRLPAISTLFAFLLVGQTSTCLAGDARGVLRINPFERPIVEDIRSAQVPAESRVEAPELRLRAVMLAGSGSLANIGGTIMGIGEEIEGYRLVSITERNVVLNKHGKARTLSIDD